MRVESERSWTLISSLLLELSTNPREMKDPTKAARWLWMIQQLRHAVVAPTGDAKDDA